MSFDQVLEEIPRLSPEERQRLMHRVLEIEDEPFNATEESLIDSRLASHRVDPASSVSLDEMKSRLHTRFAR